MPDTESTFTVKCAGHKRCVWFISFSKHYPAPISIQRIGGKKRENTRVKCLVVFVAAVVVAAVVAVVVVGAVVVLPNENPILQITFYE